VTVVEAREREANTLKDRNRKKSIQSKFGPQKASAATNSDSNVAIKQ
jgi:hypothetical protein